MDSPHLLFDMGFSALALLMLIFLALLLSCYVKIVTVLGIVRVGLGADGLPFSFVAVGLALVLSFFVMYPTLQSSAGSMEQVLSRSARIDQSVKAEAFAAGLDRWKEFLLRHAHDSEKQRFFELARTIDQSAGEGGEPGKLVEADSWRVLAPAFIVSELKEAFATGLSLLLPFLVIDLLVASTLAAVGLERLSPATVAFPFKILLFVIADGWSLIAGNLAATYAA